MSYSTGCAIRPPEKTKTRSQIGHSTHPQLTPLCGEQLKKWLQNIKTRIKLQLSTMAQSFPFHWKQHPLFIPCMEQRETLMRA